MTGGAGHDTLDGGTGRDTIDGGAGSDTVSYASHTVGVTINLARQTAGVVGTTAYTDKIVSIENAIGGLGADRIIGSGRAETLDGGSGNDTVAGAGSNDFLTGGKGNDLLQGGAGNDTISGGTTEFGSVWDSYPDQGNDDLARRWLVDDGADTIDGGSGIDTLLIRDVVYTAYHDAGDGLLNALIDLRLGILRLDLPMASNDTLNSIENVVTGAGNDTVTGSDEPNRLDVGDGLNIVFAGGGNDTIVGGSMAMGAEHDSDQPFVEQLSGEDGNDLILGNGSYLSDWDVYPGTDYLDGGAGDDTLVAGSDGDCYAVGGAGADHFVFTNETGYWGADELPRAKEVTIADFDPSSGDRIEIDITNEFNPRDPQYIGDVESLGDVGLFELGYVRLTDDHGDGYTQLRFSNYDSDDAIWGDAASYAVNITLAGYAGALAASDFIFV